MTIDLNEWALKFNRKVN